MVCEQNDKLHGKLWWVIWLWHYCFNVQACVLWSNKKNNKTGENLGSRNWKLNKRVVLQPKEAKFGTRWNSLDKGMGHTAKSVSHHHSVQLLRAWGVSKFSLYRNLFKKTWHVQTTVNLIHGKLQNVTVLQLFHLTYPLAHSNKGGKTSYLR